MWGRIVLRKTDCPVSLWSLLHDCWDYLFQQVLCVPSLVPNDILPFKGGAPWPVCKNYLSWNLRRDGPNPNSRKKHTLRKMALMPAIPLRIWSMR